MIYDIEYSMNDTQKTQIAYWRGLLDGVVQTTKCLLDDQGRSCCVGVLADKGGLGKRDDTTAGNVLFRFGSWDTRSSKVMSCVKFAEWFECDVSIAEQILFALYRLNDATSDGEFTEVKRVFDQAVTTGVLSIPKHGTSEQ